MTVSTGGKNPDLCTLLHKGGKRAPFCRRMVFKAFHAHTHNMQESQDNVADSVGLMSQVTESAAFCFIQRKDTSEEMPFLEDR